MGLPGWKLHKKEIIDVTLMLLYSTTLRNFAQMVVVSLKSLVYGGFIYILQGLAIVN